MRNTGARVALSTLVLMLPAVPAASLDVTMSRYVVIVDGTTQLREVDQRP